MAKVEWNMRRSNRIPSAKVVSKDRFTASLFIRTAGRDIPAMALADAVVRLIPGVLGGEDSAKYDSFTSGSDALLEGPVYTRPSNYRGMKVPEVLLSGDHSKINAWKRRQALRRTETRRPDLLKDWPPGESS